MNIKSAVITFADGRVVEIEGGTLQSLAHKMLEDCQPELSIAIPDEKKKEWERMAHKDYVSQPVTDNSFESYKKLFVRKECEKYFIIERAKFSQHELLMSMKKSD